MPKYRVETDKGTYEIETDFGPAAQATQRTLAEKYPQYLGPGANTDGSLAHLTGLDRPVLDQVTGAAKGVWNSTVGGLLEMGRRAGSVMTQPDQATAGDRAALLLGGPAGVLAKDLVSAHIEMGRRAWDALKRGEGLEATGYGLAAITPGVGPMAAQFGEQIAGGQAAEGLGGAVGATVIPEAIRRVRPGVSVGGPARLTAEEAASNAFAEAKQIPLDYGTARNSSTARYAQKQVQNGIGGAGHAKEFRTQQNTRLHEVGQELAAEVHPDEITPLQAGADTQAALRGRFDADTQAANNALITQGRGIAGQLAGSAAVPETAANAVRGEVRGQVTKYAKAANQRYSPVWELEKDPANHYELPVRANEEGKPVYETVALPVQYLELKKRAIELGSKWAYSIPDAQRRADPGLHILKQIAEGDNFKSASAAEIDLGLLKELTRKEAGLPEGGKSISHLIVSQIQGPLQELIDAAVKNAKRTEGAGSGPRAFALPAGQAAEPRLLESAPVEARNAAGAQTSVEVPGTETQYPATYAVRELGEVVPSHDPFTFQRNRDYAHANDRDYTRTDNQGKVIEWSGTGPQGFKPRNLLNDSPTATSGPPIVDAEGNALGGNGRAMILNRVYRDNPEGAAAYRQMLLDKASQFGLDPEQIRGMQNPVLVRDAGAVADPQRAISDFNVKETAELRPSERAVSESRRVSPATLDDLGRRLDDAGAESTLSDVLEGKSGTEVLDKLIDDGVISRQERAGLAEGDVLSKEGKARIQAVLLGRFFSDPRVMDATPLAVRNKLGQMAAPLASVEGRAGWSMQETVSGALDLLHEARAARMPVDDFIHQGGLFNEQKYGPQVQNFARHLENSTQTKLRAAARQYASDAAYGDGGSMFGDAPNPEQSFSEAFGDAPRSEPRVPATAESTAVTGPQAKSVAVPVGGEAYGNLKEGRRLTAIKHDALSVVEKFMDEPVQLYSQLTHARDSGVDFLRRVQKWAPDSLPKVARAFFDGLVDTATADGGLSKTQAIREAWRKLGPETKQILFGGGQVDALDKWFRSATDLETATKADIVHRLTTESVPLYDRLTRDKDAAVTYLSEVEKRTPESMPKIARGYLQAALDRLGEKGKGNLEHSDAVYADWQKLGDETKRKLFRNPKLIGDLDNFFLLMKRIGENPNPSGTAGGVAMVTATGLLVTSPFHGLPAYLITHKALSHLLFSPKFHAAVSRGLKVNLGNKAAAAMVAGAIVKAAGDEAQPVTK